MIRRLKHLYIIICILFSNSLFAKMYHHFVNIEDIKDSKVSYIWQEDDIEQFNELIISWNAKRPDEKAISFYVSMNIKGKWTPWLLYAKWGKDFQKSNVIPLLSDKSDYKTYQNVAQVTNDKKGNAYKIKVVAEAPNDIEKINSIHVCASDIDKIVKSDIPYFEKSIYLDVSGLSQMALDDGRKERFCSPTSTTAVINFLKGNKIISPIDFAEKSWDKRFDIYGSWIFNVAEAYNTIGDEKISIYVERVDSFLAILKNLEINFPSIISVRSPLLGSAKEYQKGHLLAVIGFDHVTKEVICMDPAFDDDMSTICRYKLNDLIEAWQRRKNIVYIFCSSKNL